MKFHAADDEGLPSPYDDVHETIVPSPLESAARESEPDFIISSDITAQFPIGPAELEAIETYFGHLLDLVLSGKKTDAATLPCHKRVR